VRGCHDRGAARGRHDRALDPGPSRRRHVRALSSSGLIGLIAVSILQTDRLRLRRVSLDDAEFIVELLNEPSWLRFIGDKGVRTIEDGSAG
jgi:RimJ/RimL family protein N-acetyltransferase